MKSLQTVVTKKILMFKLEVFEILVVVWRSRLQGLRVPLQVSGERHQVHRVQVGQLAGQVGAVSSLELDTHGVQQGGEAGVVLHLVRGEV